MLILSSNRQRELRRPLLAALCISELYRGEGEAQERAKTNDVGVINPHTDLAGSQLFAVAQKTSNAHANRLNVSSFSSSSSASFSKFRLTATPPSHHSSPPFAHPNSDIWIQPSMTGMIGITH